MERPKGNNPTKLEDYKRHPAGTYNIGCELCGPRSGHIATCFPRANDVDDLKNYKTNNFVIQAGETIGVKPYKEFIGKDYDGKVKAQLYLGYATK